MAGQRKQFSQRPKAAKKTTLTGTGTVGALAKRSCTSISRASWAGRLASGDSFREGSALKSAQNSGVMNEFTSAPATSKKFHFPMRHRLDRKDNRAYQQRNRRPSAGPTVCSPALETTRRIVVVFSGQDIDSISSTRLIIEVYDCGAARAPRGIRRKSEHDYLATRQASR